MKKKLIQYSCRVLFVIVMALILIGCSKRTNQEGLVTNEIADVTSGLDELDSTDELEETYEYYLTKEELIDDIENGYIFRMDKVFSDPATPMVLAGNWPFYVYEDNAMNLEIEFSNLFPETGEEDDALKKFKEPLVEVKVVTPEGDVVYSFVRRGDEIIKETFVTEQITLYPGEWNLQIGFIYHSKGGDTPSNLKISALYENPSKEDITWLKDNRL